MAKECCNKKLGTVGGQAVIEGIMMKSKTHYALSVRMPDGSIKTEVDKSTTIRDKYKILRLPIIRGVVNMIETLILSYSTLTKSAEALGIDEEEEESKFEKWLKKTFGKSIFDIIMVIATILGFALAFFLFSFLPSLVTKAVDNGTNGALGWFKNLMEGLIKMAIFIGYIWAVSFMKDIKRTFQYHGAEHKSIFCYESGEELTPENAAKFTRFHPRCGTSFLFVMLALSILVYSLPFISWDNMILRVLLKVLFLPVIVGLGYEFLMYAGKHNNVVTRVLSAPGLWIQRLTTKEPTTDMLEVAIAALKAALPNEFPVEEKVEEIVEENAEGATEEINNTEETVEETPAVEENNSENNN